MTPARKIQLHLQRSAHTLSTLSPATAAHLMTVHQAHMLDARVALPTATASAQDVCSACGTVLIPGWSCAVSMAGGRVGESEGRGGEGKAVLFVCKGCGGERKVELSARAERVRRRKSGEAEKPMEDGGAEEKTGKGVRKRAKLKKGGGLKAMVARSKAATGTKDTGFGLGLMDLMKRTG
ncbi:MAG: hypothetical protein M1814_000102 [Vezdaea aestivalis]|nr:MAG: hypothetical protein M1814_000102 [Vezdaea aestivalis]